jgi:hypothetical protein
MLVTLQESAVRQGAWCANVGAPTYSGEFVGLGRV